MNKKKALIIYISTIVGLLLVFGIALLILFPRINEESVVDKINNSEQLQVIYPVEATPTDSVEVESVKAFFSTLTSSFFENDVNSFNELLREKRIPWITLDSEERICASLFIYPSDVAENTYIKNGKLIEVSTETDPPEVETGLSATLFGENSEPVFRESATRAGFIEHASWYDADVEYINEHFDSIYDELAWTIEMNPDQSGSAGWSIYKLSNNTYIISNGISWYSDETCSREFAGKVFVVKRLNDEVYDNELKIVAFIDVI